MENIPMLSMNIVSSVMSLVKHVVIMKYVLVVNLNITELWLDLPVHVIKDTIMTMEQSNVNYVNQNVWHVIIFKTVRNAKIGDHKQKHLNTNNVHAQINNMIN